jgi:hypothetical protein
MKQYLPVNWVDGMKMSKDHFIAERNAFLQTLSGSTGAFINAVNYGLLPPVAAEHNPFNIHVSLDNQDMVTIKLISCRAVTPGGHLLFVDEKSQYSADNLTASPVLQTPLSDFKEKPGVYAVIVSINPYDRVAVGNALMEELPPRIPFSAPQLSLSLVPRESLEKNSAGLNHLCVANILIEKNRVQKSEEYIAPCTSTSSHPDLVDIFYGLDEFMSKMELYSLQILQRINQKKQTNELAVLIQQICERLLHFQNTSFSLFRWSAMHLPPHVMFSHIAAQARLLKNSLDIYLNAGKEELMNYFTEWCDLNQGELETVITEVSNHLYRHEDIQGAVVKTLAYTKQVSSLFYKLSRLDYIGKKKDSGIFVKEEVVKPNVPTAAVKKRWSFLGDE